MFGFNSYSYCTVLPALNDYYLIRGLLKVEGTLDLNGEKSLNPFLKISVILQLRMQVQYQFTLFQLVKNCCFYKFKDSYLPSLHFPLKKKKKKGGRERERAEQQPVVYFVFHIIITGTLIISSSISRDNYHVIQLSKLSYNFLWSRLSYLCSLPRDSFSQAPESGGWLGFWIDKLRNHFVFAGPLSVLSNFFDVYH